MSKPKWTQGPLRAVCILQPKVGNETWGVKRPAFGEFTAVLDSPRAKADATLYAASTDMYDALAGLIAAWEAEMRSLFGEHSLPDFEEVPQVQIARLALAKANPQPADAPQKAEE